MHTPDAETSLTTGGMAPWRFSLPRAHYQEADWFVSAPVDAEEPEIVRMLAAHCRALLQLQRLTPAQRFQLRRLLARYEACLAVGGRCDLPRPDETGGCSSGALHEPESCLTAIRLYAAGAQRALALHRPDLAEAGLARLIREVERARAVLSIAAGTATG